MSKIASVIGRPICMDHATATGTSAFPRVCIEVGLDADFPREIRMKSKGTTIVQKVEYAWKPNPCKACPLKVSAPKPKQIWIPKKSQLEQVLTAIPTKSMNGTDHINHGDWTVVKDGKASSPKVQLDRPASPMKNESDSATLMGKINRFSSLSNLDGESNASVEELAAATSLVLATSVVDDHHHISGMLAIPKTLSSIHQLDKNLLPKLPTSSSSAKHKPVSTGIIIKENGTKNQSS